MDDATLYQRGIETLVDSWEAYAHGASGAAVLRSPGLAVAVFPDEPERAVYNNALVERDLADAQRAVAIDMLEAAYAAARVTHFAVWVHETDRAMRADLERRSYTFDESTRAMGMIARRHPSTPTGDRTRATGLVRVPAHPRVSAGFSEWRRPRRLSRPDRPSRRRERRDGDGIRSRRRLRDL